MKSIIRLLCREYKATGRVAGGRTKYSVDATVIFRVVRDLCVLAEHNFAASGDHPKL